ncbi:MAG: hypothetical protein ACAH95_14640 [Fimbriimonas sp.]
MELRKTLYTPAWRDPKVIRAQSRSMRMRPVVAFLTAGCLLALFLPDKMDYGKAISIQLATGGFSARSLFLLMFVTLGYVGVRLWHWGAKGACTFAAFTMLTLGVIAFTHPFSKLHNTAFVALSISLCTGHAALFYRDIDGRLFLPAVGALAGLCLCPFSLGVGERLMVASTCVSLCILYYGDLDP